MDAAEVMNTILSLECPSDVGDNGRREFTINLHCLSVKIVATPNGRVYRRDESSTVPQDADDYLYSTWSIDSFEVVSDDEG